MTSTITVPPATTPPSPTVSAAARACDVDKVYGRGHTAVPALHGVSVAFAAHSFTAIMGPSGSGKSTLLQCLAGLDSVTAGHVFLGGVDLTRCGERELTTLRRERIGFVFQSFNLVPTFSAIENIRLPFDLARCRPDRDWLHAVIDVVGLGDRLHHRPAELSGGQQQRVAIARALARRPEVIFADEPTGNLDSRAGSEILTFMRRAVRELGQTVVMVTHDPVAASHGERVVFLADGQLAGDLVAPTAELVLDTMARLGR
jgi:putative ABC transport system ATP-binding protein